MYQDALLQLSAAQAVTATALSTNTIDLGNSTVKRAIGDGEPMAIQVCISVAANFASSDETYNFQVVQSAAAALTTPTVLASEAYIATGALISSLLIAGYMILLPIPAGMPNQRFIGVNYVTGGTGPTMTVTAFLTPLRLGMVSPKIYSKGYVIS